LVEAHATVRAVLRRTIEALEAAGVDSAALDARLIFDHALGRRGASRAMSPDAAVTPDAIARIDRLAGRRVAREPMAMILGMREFWSLDFEVSGDTLVPRPESELAVELALTHMKGGNGDSRILDLGTGTGCLLLSLLHERAEATGIGVDFSAGALRVARANARRLGLEERARFIQGDWAAPVSGTFDIVVANPPYVAEADYGRLEPEIRDFEPYLAVVGGPDGLDCYRRFAGDMPRLLAPGGAVIVECGRGQAGDVAALLEAAGLGHIEIERDFAGIERCVLATN
jgi:release factor glutamine methyltransferase